MVHLPLYRIPQSAGRPTADALRQVHGLPLFRVIFFSFLHIINRQSPVKNPHLFSNAYLLIPVLLKEQIVISV